MATQSATSEIQPVILAGGSGTRLWPLSNERYPKQFLRLTGETSLLQQTLSRLGGLRCQAPIVVCNDKHQSIVADQCLYCGEELGGVVLEPVSRNTAPATAIAAIAATGAATGGAGIAADPVLFVLPADHFIADETAFAAVVERGVPFAEKHNIVVFGIPPTHPAPGYGYIRARAGANGGGVAEVARVAAFAEKPGLTTAEQYLAEGGWYWNSGMFLFRASVYLDELETHRPDILKACNAAIDVAAADEGVHLGACAVEVSRQRDFQRDHQVALAGDAFRRCPTESIDRAIMEKTRRGVVVPADMGWSDVGTWDSLAEVLPFTKRTRRPWGHAETFRSRDGFRLTRLTILPGKTREDPDDEARHWVVVRGLAEVVSPYRRLALPAGESIDVPSGLPPRLINAGEEALVIIELRTSLRFHRNGTEPFDYP